MKMSTLRRRKLRSQQGFTMTQISVMRARAMCETPEYMERMRKMREYMSSIEFKARYDKAMEAMKKVDWSRIDRMAGR